MDANTNHTGEDQENVNRLIVKLLIPPCCTEAEKKAAISVTLDKFWDKFEHYHAKTGPFGNRPHIWNSTDLPDCSHLWHKKNSLRYTTYLGKVACLVCSKILGIGSAERCWGTVKHNKIGKRSHLSAEAVKMQSTIFGAYAADKADLRRQCKDEGVKQREQFWDDDDFKTLGLTKYGVDLDKLVENPKKIFRAWMEDWEDDIIKVNDPVNQARFLEKYGGIVWHDPDNNVNFTANTEKMYFNRGRKDKGYCVYGLRETYDANNPQYADDWEPW